MEKEKESDGKTNKEGWEEVALFFRGNKELMKTRKSQRELMERFKDNPICSKFFAFEREYSVGTLGLDYIMGTAYDFRDEDEDDNIRPY